MRQSPSRHWVVHSPTHRYHLFPHVFCGCRYYPLDSIDWTWQCHCWYNQRRPVLKFCFPTNVSSLPQFLDHRPIPLMIPVEHEQSLGYLHDHASCCLWQRHPPLRHHCRRHFPHLCYYSCCYSYYWWHWSYLMIGDHHFRHPLPEWSDFVSKLLATTTTSTASWSTFWISYPSSISILDPPRNHLMQCYHQRYYSLNASRDSRPPILPWGSSKSVRY